jgi:hypothetical protein
MKLALRLGLVIIGTLLLAGCATPFARGHGAGQQEAADSPPAPVSATPAGTGTVPAGPGDEATQAVMAVIQRANDEQQQAFAVHDPTVMRDTATTEYYDQLVQIERDLENAGVSAIKLLKLEWGPVSVQDASAQATTYETWQTTWTDGSTEQDRERNVYTLVQQAGAWKVQADDHPDANLDQPAGSAGGNPRPTSPPLPVAPTGTDQSNNWSGYAATGGTFTAVSGTWTVPQVTGTETFAGDATWVGIGGVHTRDLIQAGTDATVLSPGRVRYSAWIETLPQPARPVPLAVSPGDSITVSVTQQSSGDWLIAFENHTTGQRYQSTESYDSSLSSAEWVEEAPAGGRRVLPLDDFGSVPFRDGSAVLDGRQVTIAQAGAGPITMVDRSGRPIARPSALGNDGSSFSVSRLADAPAAVPAPARGRPLRGATSGGVAP